MPLTQSETGKSYALAIAKDDFSEAWKIASRWAPLVNTLIDGERIVDSNPAQQILAVFKFYADAGADLSRVVK